ncbi:MAG: Zn-ribbon domain-containing OB-fold protein [Desulfarculaceae bacterium]|nr:Zn-ribbon domain-containing OB-fold protein [Desulfarculaceae bacterium]MCF8047009.1 Zn-ribbon domain-containing OB-fold protein [Desulfarculaceae bacterium]MCF8066359.1 Zn-ribbon domain-containing OB-fold protein [Desulfarculaceae bacterium]MCF8096519.1 Zn-ribbon domain-containing OB-fold protein [Desulfarculaceae bacterium]MCF8121773.1 Zn-ribbon domain-containing OB-fold protein [Desulfarculaceae bacterium]
MQDMPFSDSSFQKHLDQGRLMGCRCNSCQELYTPPRPLCPTCRLSRMEWVAMSGKGRLCAFTAITVPPPALKQEGFSRDNPYAVGVVELAEGTRVVARLLGLELSDPDSVALGQPMEVVFIKGGPDGSGDTVLGFQPAAE